MQVLLREVMKLLSLIVIWCVGSEVLKSRREVIYFLALV